MLSFLLFISKIEAQSTIETIGDYGLYSMPIIAIGTTILNKDTKGLFMYGKSFALNTAVTFTLKEVIRKKRPNGEDSESFPSAHTSITFQGAAYLQKRYGWNYGIPAYLIAGYTGFSRVHADKHFIEDVASGALLGILSSYLFTKNKIDTSTSFSFDKKGKDLYISFAHKF